MLSWCELYFIVSRVSITSLRLFVVFLLVNILMTVQADSHNKPADRKLIIGYSGSPTSVDYWKKLKGSLFLNAQQQDVVVIDFTGKDFALSTQLQNLEHAASLDIDGMIIGAVSDKISDSISIFQEKNIPVIAVNSNLSHNWVLTSISTNEHEAAEMASLYIQSRLKKQKISAKQIIILCGDEIQYTAIIRSLTPKSILSDAGYHTKVFYSKGWASIYSVRDAISEFSSNGENIAAVFSCFADASIASVETAESYGFRPLLVGFDMDKTMQNMIREGRLDATVIQDPVQIGKLSIEKMVDRLRNKVSLPRNIYVPARLVTSENVDELP